MGIPEARPVMCASLLRQVYRHMDVTKYFTNHSDDFRTLTKDLSALIVRHKVKLEPWLLVRELLCTTFWREKVSSEYELVAFFSNKKLTHVEFTKAVSGFVMTANQLLEREERNWMIRNNIVQKLKVGSKVSIGNNVELRVDSIVQGNHGYYWVVDLKSDKGQPYKYEDLEGLVFAQLDNALSVLSAPENYTYKKGC